MNSRTSLRIARDDRRVSAPGASQVAAQILHLGPYDTEAETIKKLHAFIAERGLERRGKHHEIYLGDPRRAAPERLKTIIRQPVG